MIKGAWFRGVFPAILLSAGLGLVAVVTPAFFMTTAPSHRSPLFRLVHVAVEGFGLAAVFGLFADGLITRLAFRAPFWLIGLSSMAAFPIMAIAEMLIDPRSHSLFPVEFFFYAAECLFATLGAIVGGAWFRLLGWRRKALHGA